MANMVLLYDAFVDPAKQIDCGIRCYRIINWVFKFVWSTNNHAKNQENKLPWKVADFFHGNFHWVSIFEVVDCTFIN
jgi:hypothetical protein